jgi:uncharacterized OB-fold protein
MGKIPIREGLFAERIEGEIVGFKCGSCHHILPPLTIVCYYCYGKDLEKVALSRHGKLYSYTVVYQPHKHFKVPYAVGFIDLPEGIRIFSPLKKREGKPFHVGMDMELIVETLWNENEDEIIGPIYQPV